MHSCSVPETSCLMVSQFPFLYKESIHYRTVLKIHSKTSTAEFGLKYTQNSKLLLLLPVLNLFDAHLLIRNTKCRTDIFSYSLDTQAEQMLLGSNKK